jgi:hypothetical protein
LAKLSQLKENLILHPKQPSGLHPQQRTLPRVPPRRRRQRRGRSRTMEKDHRPRRNVKVENEFEEKILRKTFKVAVTNGTSFVCTCGT